MTTIGYCKTTLLSSAKGECKPCVQILWSMSLAGTLLFILGMLIACCCCCCCLAGVAKVDKQKKSKKILAGEITLPLTRKQSALKFADETFVNLLRVLKIPHVTYYDDDSLASSNGGTKG